MGYSQTIPARHEVAPGVVLLTLPETRFKRARVSLLADLPLDDGRAARSLLLDVLEQGSARHPGRVAVARAEQEAYGARIALGRGSAMERHRLRLGVEVVGGRFLPPGEEVLGPALDLAGGLVAAPWRGEDGSLFREELVERERKLLLQRIRERIDHRSEWAEERFLHHLCADEPLGLLSWDSEEAVEAVDMAQLEAERRRILKEAVVLVLAVGPLDESVLLPWLKELFPADRKPWQPPAQELRTAGELREVREELPLDQAQFHLGMRFTPPADAAGRAALHLANTVYGGGVQGRLFRIVREEKSLAYGIGSMLRPMKGLLTVAAGIDASAADDVQEAVLEQQADLAAQGPSVEELDTARLHILDRLAAVGDDAGRLGAFHQREFHRGTFLTPAQWAEHLEAVGPAEVAAAAADWQPDLRYLLAPEGSA
jgi:predicted Zn-dependent peptidase